MVLRISVVLGFLLLGGCVVAPPVYDSDPEEFSAVPETHGVVVFQGVTLDARLNPYMFGWHTVRASRIGGPPVTWLKPGEKAPVKYHIYPDYSTIPGTTLWVGVLPAGNYLAEDFYSSFNNGQYFGHLAVSIMDAFAAFTIEPGKVTVLDTYFYKGLGDKHLLANVAPRSDLIAAAKKAHPDIMNEVDTSSPLGFAAEGRQRDADVEAGLLRWAATVGDAEYSSDGRTYRGARAGQLFERTPDGKWRRLALPTFEPIEVVTADKAGGVIAITLGGEAWHRDSADAEFERVPLSFEGKLQTLAPMPDGRWLAGVRRTTTETDKFGERKDTHVLHMMTAQTLGGPWESFKTMQVVKPYADAEIIGERVFVGNPEGKGKSFHLGTGEAKTLPAGFAFMRKYPSGVVLGYTTYETGFWGTEPAQIWMSRDHGSTWLQLSDKVKPMGMPEYIGNGEVLMVGQRTNRTRKEINADVPYFEGLVQTRADAMFWDKVEVVPEECTGWIEIREIDSGRLLLCEYEAFRRPEGRAEWFKENMRGFEDDASGEQ